MEREIAQLLIWVGAMFWSALGYMGFCLVLRPLGDTTLKILASNLASLTVCVLIAGFGAADGGAPQFIYGLHNQAFPQALVAVIALVRKVRRLEVMGREGAPAAPRRLASLKIGSFRLWLVLAVAYYGVAISRTVGLANRGFAPTLHQAIVASLLPIALLGIGRGLIWAIEGFFPSKPDPVRDP